MSAPKILLTGSRGVLGRAILDALVSDGHHVRVVSRDKAYKPAHDCEVVVGDLTDWIFTESLAQNCDVVIHCAGEKRDAARFESGNINTTENLIGAANKNRASKFIYVSSVGVYGKTSSPLIDETHSCNPANDYERSKLIAEKSVLSRAKMPALIARPTNVYDDHGMLSLGKMPTLKRVLKGREKTHFIHSKNVAAAITHLATRDVKQKIYNISRDHQENETYRTLVEMLSEESVKEISLPIHIIHWLRLMKNGYSNLGNKTYSGALLTDEGFEYPHALEALIKDAKNNER